MEILGDSLIEFSIVWRVIFRNREFQIKSVFSVKMHGGSRVFFFQKFVILKLWRIFSKYEQN